MSRVQFGLAAAAVVLTAACTSGGGQPHGLGPGNSPMPGLRGQSISNSPTCPAWQVNWPGPNATVASLPGTMEELLVCKWTHLGAPPAHVILHPADAAYAGFVKVMSAPDQAPPSATAACALVGVLEPGVYALVRGSGWWRLHLPSTYCRTPQDAVRSAFLGFGT